MAPLDARAAPLAVDSSRPGGGRVRDWCVHRTMDRAELSSVRTLCLAQHERWLRVLLGKSPDSGHELYLHTAGQDLPRADSARAALAGRGSPRRSPHATWVR